MMTPKQRKLLKALVSAGGEALRTAKAVKTIDLDPALHGQVMGAKLELVFASCEAVLDGFDEGFELVGSPEPGSCDGEAGAEPAYQREEE